MSILISEITQCSQRVAETGSRLEKIQRLSGLLSRLSPDEIGIGVAYLSGELRQGRIGLGPALVQEALAATPADASTLTLRQTDETFGRIAQATGSGSTTSRGDLLRGLFGRATREEQDFLVRLVLGELRQGALAGLMVEAVANAAEVAAEEVRRALMFSGDLAVVATAALTEGPGGLRRFTIRLLHPVLPMLAQTAEDVGDALERFGRAALEWKLDGARIQVHKSATDVRVFTRNLNDVTAAVPEIVELVRSIPAREIILDGEALALRPDRMPYPFQTTMRRFGRKLDVARMRETLPLAPFFFDCLYLEGDSLIDSPERERFRILASALPSGVVIPRLVTRDAAEAEAFLDEAVGKGHEGIMAKSLDACYEAGRRGSSWLKVKPAVTLDLVVLAAEWGHGRRRGWLSNLHLGARDPVSGAFIMLGKTFKGMTDEMLVWQTKRLLEMEVARDAWTVYVRPELVVEVAFNEIQESPRYPGGLALRFARVRRYRPDKTPNEADTIDTVRAIFARQRGERL